MPAIAEMLARIPPVSRYWMLSILVVAAAVQIHVVNPYQLYFSFKIAFVTSFQPWRLVTTFLYHGPLGYELLLYFLWFFRYGRWLEQTFFANKPAEYLMLLLVSAALIIVIAPPFALPFLQPSLAFSLIYIWSRKNPHEQVALFWLIHLPAPYLPVAMIVISGILAGSMRSLYADVVGCIVGHIVWFLMEVWPLEMSSGDGWSPLKPPQALKDLLGDL
ncbi:hypothetical protein FRB91_008900 [Serendipita sp. 411]|nr:hypothetical protein FRB91_008900 [Serendipita sp. 411]